MNIRSRLEFFLAKLAGRDIDVNTITPAGASNMVEKLLLEISDRFDLADKGFSSISKIKDYLYEIYYDNLDYDQAYKYFSTTEDIGNIGACSAVRKDSFYGRNLDWRYNSQAEFIVHTSRSAGRYATIGVAGGMRELTEKSVSIGKLSKAYKILPFKLYDGINECGVIANMNVVPMDKGLNRSVPTVSNKATVSGQMLVRYIIDHFATASEAVQFIREHVSVYFPKSLHDLEYELHFMVADKNKTFLIEFIDNEAVITEMTSGSNTTLDGKEYMTNFFLSDVIFNSDGTVYTPADYGTGSASEDNNITPHGSGLERYNYITENISTANTKVGMRNLMNNLFYTKAYPTSEAPSNPFWYTEFVGLNGLTVDNPTGDFAGIVSAAGEMYLKRDRNTGEDTWQTVHSAVYDMNNVTLNIVVQEDGEELNFSIGDTIESLKQRIEALEN